MRRIQKYSICCAAAFGSLLATATEAAQAPPPIAIEHVTVVPMTAGPAALADRTVIIRDGRIASIAPSAKAVVPRGAKRISGVGKWLMPSLTDSHVHLENDRLLRLYLHEPALPDGTIRNADLFTPYVANGVLQVIDLSAMRETIAQRAEIESGKVLGPHIALAAMIDGDPPIWPVGMTRVAATPDAGRKAVDAAHEEGFEIIKAYSNLSLPTFTAIVAEARRLKMRVVGHIPGRDQGITEKFFQPGFDLVAHAEEFAQQTKDPSEADIPRYVEMSKHNGTWLIATLTLDDRILQEVSHPEVLKTRPEIQFITPALYPIVTEHNPYAANASPGQADYLRRVVAFNSKLVKAFADAGIPVLAGTDTPVPGLVAGFSLHDELEAMARAGLTNRKVLEGATRLPAEWLGVAGDRGTVASGKRADLLLLDADPLADVANTRRISAVVDGGRYLPRVVLDQLMNELKARYARARGSDGPN